VIVDPNTITLSDPIQLVPEPGVAGIAFAGLATLSGLALYRRRAQR
jgi:MYXO-CTERM domain-containing protein